MSAHPHHDPIRHRDPLVGVGRGRTLAEIATNMRLLLADRENGWAQSNLSRGLAIILQRNGDRWRLALGREGTPPSDSEIKTCAMAFQVPEGTEPVRSEKRLRNDKTDRRLLYEIAELFWREAGA